MKKIFAISILFTLVSTVFAQTVPGIFLQDNGWLWSEKDNGVMTAKVKLSEGTDIEVYSVSKDASYENAEKGKTLNFVKVRYDSKDYWAISNRIITGKKVAVITEDAAIYNTANPADVRNAHLDRGSVVAVGETNKTDPARKVTFAEVSYYSTARYSVQTVYVKASKITDNSQDVLAFRTIQRAKELTVVDQKKTILESALNLNITDDVRKIIQDEMADLTVQFDLREGGVDSADKKSFSVHTEDGSKVNIRDFPGLGGNVVTQVEPGTALTSVQMTEREQTIDGLTAHWYEVYDAETEDYLGWIFGGFIQ